MIRVYLNIGLLFMLILPANSQQMSSDTCLLLEASDFYTQLHSSVLPLLLDIRTREDFKKERISGAVLAESMEILFKIADTLDIDQPVLLYCEFGYRSYEACKTLKDRGFRSVYNLQGGLVSWRASGFELDRKNLRNKRKGS